MADLRTSIGGIKLENPIIVASGPLTDTDEALRKVDDFGAGGVIMKTGLVESDYSRAMKPYKPHHYPHQFRSYVACHDGQMHCDGMSRWSTELWAEWFAKNKGKYRMKLIASVGGVSVEGYARGARLMEEAGAEAVEILTACPAPWFWPFKYTMSSDPAVIKEILTAVKQSLKKIPFGAKIFPWPRKLTYTAFESGASWITLGGVFVGAPEIDLDTVEPRFISDGSMAGMGPAKHMSLRAMMHSPDLIKKIDISAHGGVQSWRDVAEMILYGANSVQVLTLLMKRGLRHIKSLNRGLSEFMDEHNLATIKDMRGLILPKLLDWTQVTPMMEQTYPRLKGTVAAQVDPDICNGCKICWEVCPFDAIRMEDKLAVSDPKKCDGCAMCIMACPVHAIKLNNEDLYVKEARRIAASLPRERSGRKV